MKEFSFKLLTQLTQWNFHLRTVIQLQSRLWSRWKVLIMTLLKKTVLILPSSPMITLFACHLETQLWIALAAAALGCITEAWLSQLQWHTLARQMPQVEFRFWFSEFSVVLLSLLFHFTLGHFLMCALHPFLTKPRAHLQGPRSWTHHTFAYAVPLK